MNNLFGLSFRMWSPIIFSIITISFLGLIGCAGDNSSDTPSDDSPTTTVPTDDTNEATENTEETATVEMRIVTLPGGLEIKFAKGGFEDAVVQFLNADEQDFDQEFVMDGIAFKEGSDIILPESQEQINNLTALLSTYFDYKVELEIFSKENEDVNADKVLSSNRAKALKSALVAKGVEAKRIATKGSGQGSISSKQKTIMVFK